MRPLAVLIAPIALALFSATTWAAADEAAIDSGKLKGVVLDGIVSFKGIPFARPPVGALRWRPPQPVEHWAGVRSAAAFGPDCAQSPAGAGVSQTAKLSEDCLYINVWAPASGGKKLPVMVWIYGGGFVQGGSSVAVNDGKYFAKDGLVYINFNYRLGRVGFFAHPALTKERPNELHGNYGYMDQLAALKWIKRNVAAFGGDPGNITIFGESAGGASVLTMMTSPLAKGLFQKGIVESGGGRTLLMGRRYLHKSEPGGPPSAESVGVAFAKSVGIEGEDAAALAALRKLSTEQVTASLNMNSMSGARTYGGPMIDGKLVVESPGEAYAAGHGMKIPFIAGATGADLGTATGSTLDEMFARFGADKDRVRALYDPTGAGALRDIAQALGGDETMGEPSRFIVRTVAATGQPAWEFRFSYVPEARRATVKGAAHSSEVGYVFGAIGGRSGQPAAGDLATAQAMHAYWVNFGKTGNPNGPGLPKWDKYDPRTDIILDFTLDGPFAQPDPRKARFDAVEKLAGK
jgi:para-nitrobenzyl esterase